MRNFAYERYDLEAIKILQDFLPDHIFDAHAHPYDTRFLPNTVFPEGQPPVAGVEEYRQAMLPIFGENRTLAANFITYPDKAMADLTSGCLQASDQFLIKELNKDENYVGEILVCPDETTEDLEKRLVHDQIRGFKCYHLLSKRDVTWHSEIGEYLPESAWEVADKRGMAITLHMVKDKALADPGNLRYITEMSKKYPNAILILAHAARSFAAWTAVETVQALKNLENVWFDLSAVCESPAMFQILKHTGTDRCMWGSDYAINMYRGKAISLADSFYWIYQRDLDNFVGKTEFHSWLIGIENLMATRQACIMADLSTEQIEKIFCKNAQRLFFNK